MAKKRKIEKLAASLLKEPKDMRIEELKDRSVSERDKAFIIEDEDFKLDVRTLGRPSKYKPEYAAQMTRWFLEKRMKVSPNGNVYRVLPTINKFSLSIGVPRETLWVWANKKRVDGELAYPEFHNAMKLAKQIEEDVLAENTYNGSYQSTFAQLMAKNMLGWRDKTDVDVKSDGKELKRATLGDMSDEDINNFLSTQAF